MSLLPEEEAATLKFRSHDKNFEDKKRNGLVSSIVSSRWTLSVQLFYQLNLLNYRWIQE